MNRWRQVKGEGGFTLPELLIVMLILGLLMAIAIPSFLGQKKDGQDSQAQAALRAGLAAERTRYVDYQVYTEDQPALRAIESNVVWDTTDAKISGVMAKVGGDPAGSVVVLVSTSSSDNQFCVMNIATDQTIAVNGQSAAGTYYVRNPNTVSTPPTSVGLAECGATGYTRDSAAGWAGS